MFVLARFQTLLSNISDAKETEQRELYTVINSSCIINLLLKIVVVPVITL